MKYNPNFHHRRSVRLKGYEYSKAGLYFITICCKNRECFFGEIVKNGKEQIVSISKSGEIALDSWLEIPLHFPEVILHEFVVMPNHIHGIIEIDYSVGAKHLSPRNGESEVNVGAKHLSPGNGESEVNVGAKHLSTGNGESDGNVEAKHLSPGNNDSDESMWPNIDSRANVDSPQQADNKFKSPSKTIGSIIRGYKIGVTKWHRAYTDIYDVWQRSYHDHVIRNEEAYLKISNYIKNNPDSWKDDRFYNS